MVRALSKRVMHDGTCLRRRMVRALGKRVIMMVRAFSVGWYVP